MKFYCPEVDIFNIEKSDITALGRVEAYYADFIDSESGRVYPFYYQFDSTKQVIQKSNVYCKDFMLKYMNQYPINQALYTISGIATALGITITTNFTDASTYIWKYSKIKDLNSSQWYTVFGDDQVYFIVPIRSSGSNFKGTIEEKNIIGEFEQYKTDGGYSGESGFDYTIAIQDDLIIPQLVNSTVKTRCLNKYKSGGNIFIIRSGVEAVPGDWVYVQGAVYIILSRTEDSKNKKVFYYTCVKEVNGSYSFSGGDVVPSYGAISGIVSPENYAMMVMDSNGVIKKATNLFYDTTTERLGIGLNNPASKLSNYASLVTAGLGANAINWSVNWNGGYSAGFENRASSAHVLYLKSGNTDGTSNFIWANSGMGDTFYVKTSGGVYITSTWNNSGIDYHGLKINITNTASSSASKIMDIQLASVSCLQISRTGNVSVGKSGSANDLIGNWGFVNTADKLSFYDSNANLYRGAVDTIYTDGSFRIGQNLNMGQNINLANGKYINHSYMYNYRGGFLNNTGSGGYVKIARIEITSTNNAFTLSGRITVARQQWYMGSVIDFKLLAHQWTSFGVDPTCNLSVNYGSFGYGEIYCVIRQNTPTTIIDILQYVGQYTMVTYDLHYEPFYATITPNTTNYTGSLETTTGTRINPSSMYIDKGINFNYPGLNSANLYLNANDELKTDDLFVANQLATGGSTNKWTLAGYTAGAPTATGYVTITINGTTYKLAAST